MRPTTQVTGKENDMTKAKIDGVELKISEREPLLAGTVGLNKISLSFSDEWAIFTKQIDFTNEQSGETRRISAEVGVCTVPWELLRSEGDITCYVRGIGSDGSLVLRTNEANLGTVLGSADGNVPGTGTPTPDVCDETAAKIGDLSKLETDEKSQLVGAINEVKRKADRKQDKLTAGDNITIAADGTISSTGGGAEVFFLDVFVITETEVVTNKTYAEIKAAIDAGDIIYITDKNGVVYVPQVAKTNTKIELLWLDSHEDRTYRWSAVVNSENAWSVTLPELVNTDRMIADLSEKVDKVTGKGLSTNDYTAADKAKVDAIPASPKYTDTVYDDTAVKNRLTAVENEVAGIEAGSSFSGSYNDLTDKPAIPDAVTEGTVSGWGFTKNTGTYSKPTGGIPKTDLAPAVQAVIDKADALALVAESGSYNDLTDKPTIPAAVTEGTVSGWGFTKNTGTYSKPTGGIPKADLAPAVQTSLGKADSALQSHQSLAAYRTASAQDTIDKGKVDKVTGKGLSTNDYTNAAKAKVDAIPASPKYTDTVYDDTAVKNRLTAVENEVAGIEAGSSFSGSYNDLTDKPAIPDAVTEGTVSGWGFTKNTGTYSKPTGGIPKTDLAPAVQAVIDKADALALVAESGSYNDLTDKPTIPAAVTEGTVSGWGFTKNTGTYSKPTGGIPKADLAPAVQTSLGKADSALQSHQSLAAYRTASAQDTIDKGKVDKVTGKGLSTNDYTNAAKAKVDAIPASPKYTDTVYNDTAVKNRLTAIENKENVTLTANTARISNVSCTAKYFPLLGMVFVRIYGKICADLNVGYDYDLFTVGSRVPDSNAALSVKCGKNAMALAKTSSSGSAIQIRPLESGINGYDVFITGFWFA